MDTYIRAKIDTATKDKATKTLKAMGISISDYIRMAVIQVANKKTIPFEIVAPHIPNELTLKTIKKSEQGKELNSAKDADDLFKQLGI
jgi:DNA-damage-inducible protein J